MKRITLDIETVSAASRFDIDSMEVAVVGIHDSETNDYHAFEAKEIARLWPIIESADLLIGYNSNHFDIPILNRLYAGDLSRIRSIDLLAEIKNSLGRRLKLDSVAEATLGVKKTGSGLEAVEWFKKGDIERVKAYCLNDVRITKDIYEYALTHGHVKYLDFGEVRHIPLETSRWETGEKTTLTHTLPF